MENLELNNCDWKILRDKRDWEKWIDIERQDYPCEPEQYPALARIVLDSDESVSSYYLFLSDVNAMRCALGEPNS